MSSKQNSLLKTVVFSILFIAVGALIGILGCKKKYFPWCGCNQKSDTVYVARLQTYEDMCGKNDGTLPVGSELSGKRINDAEAGNLQNTFAQKFQLQGIELTKGGTIDKCIVLAAINNLPITQKYLRYSFGYSAVSNQIMLLLHTYDIPTGTNPASAGGLMPAYFRTGANPENFCPVNCYP